MMRIMTRVSRLESIPTLEAKKRIRRKKRETKRK
jgi:hypothetical protein